VDSGCAVLDMRNDGIAMTGLKRQADSATVI
jgi:hypothetical protein